MAMFNVFVGYQPPPSIPCEIMLFPLVENLPPPNVVHKIQASKKIKKKKHGGTFFCFVSGSDILYTLLLYFTHLLVLLSWQVVTGAGFPERRRVRLMLTENLGHYLRAAGEWPLSDVAVHEKGQSELLDNAKGGGDGGTGGGEEKGANSKAARPVAKVCVPGTVHGVFCRSSCCCCYYYSTHRVSNE